ncbi:MAG: hypothetical protein JKY65_29575, partial [Planctomycetes bacterium]|nr:hypothetical protein [Planctomycetota bacterium]
TGLRPLEVTEAPSLGPAASALDTKRPLFAYRWVRADHGLILRVSRPGQTEVLSAVAEHLHLSTSASSDGTARHVAVFSVKNLDNQFFGLVLPEGAELWSVAVNGQGVKPAARDGILLIPIPSAGGGSGRDATLIQATYTQTSEGWGLLGSADLQAPSLTFGASKTDTVPILKTTWALSLPEDTRVLEVAGNLQSEAQLLAVQPLLLRGWSAWRHDSWPWLVLAFGIPGLLIVATGRGRAFLFGAAQGTYRVGGACRSTAVEFPWAQLKKPVLVAAVLVALVGLAAWGFSSLSSAGRKSVQSKTAKTGGRWVYTGGNYSLPLEEEGRAGPGAFAPANEKNNGLLPGTSDEVRSKLVAEAGVNRALVELEKRSEESKKKPGKRKKYKGRRRGGRKDQAQAPPSPARKPAGAIEPAPPMDGMTQIDPPSLQLASRGDDDDDDGEAPATGRGGRFADRDAMKESGGGGLSFQEPMDAPADDSMPEEKWASENNKKVDELSTADAYGVGGGAAGAYGQRWGKGSLKSEPDITAALNIQAGKIETTGTAGARISELGSGGQVGLRSLVLELRSVGLSGAFSRSGGGAKLHLSLASERLFLVLGGLCALFGFLGAVLAPATRRLSGLALVMIGLALTTAFPLVWNGALSAALANALTLGLLSAAPVLILGSLTRGWEARPFSRLLSALRAQPTQG